MLRPRALFKEHFCGRRISSGHIEREGHEKFAYVQLDVSNFVPSVQGKEIADKIIVEKVRNSQRMNDPLVNIWIIALYFL